MERDFLPRAHPSVLTGAFHDYVRGVFADSSRHARHLHEARAHWLRGVALRMALVDKEAAGATSAPARRTRP